MKRKRLYFIAKIILRRGQIWNFPNESNRQKIDTKFPSLVSLSPFFKCKHPSAERWCLRAKFQVQPLPSRMFVINTTIRMVFEPNTTEKTWFDWNTTYSLKPLNTTFFVEFCLNSETSQHKDGFGLESDYIEERKNKRPWKITFFCFLMQSKNSSLGSLFCQCKQILFKEK